MTAGSRLGPLLPPRLLASVLDALYPRQEPELARLPEMCPGHGTALDIGAWYGPWTRQLAGRVDRVIAFEPVPEVHRVLRGAVPPTVEVVLAAASDHDGESRIWLPGAGNGSRGLASLAPREDVHHDSVPVRLVTVDSLDLAGVTFVKIDVEGHEAAALRGAEKTVRRDRPNLFIELEARIQPVGPITDMLHEWGFRGWVLPERQWVPLDGFDLRGHQERTAHVTTRGLVGRSLRPRPRYVNSVLFTPQDAPPPG